MYPEQMWKNLEKPGKRYKTIFFILCFEKNFYRRETSKKRLLHVYAAASLRVVEKVKRKRCLK